MPQFRFYNPVRIHYGAGEFGQIGELREVKGKRCLAVCYDGFDYDLIEARRVGAGSVEILDRFEANPTMEFVKGVVEIVVEREIETIIAVGGGSSIDTAKAASYLASNPGWKPGDSPTGAAGVPVVAIPSTAGTGSEVSPYAILTDASGVKRILSDSSLFPVVAVCDPKLTKGLPSRVTADSGIDVVSHVIEAYLNTKCDGHMNALASDSLVLVRQNLPKVLHEPGNLEARDAMMLSALEGGLLLAACGTVVVHAIGYALSKAWNLTHGYANGLLLSRFVEIVAEKGNPRARRILSVFDNDLGGFISNTGISSAPEKYVLTDELLDAWTDTGLASYGLANCVAPLDRDDIRDILVSSLR